MTQQKAAHGNNLRRLRETDCITIKIVNRVITTKESVAYASQHQLRFKLENNLEQRRTNDPKLTTIGEIEVHTGES